MDIKFSSIDELKLRVTPALKIRSKELKREHIYMSEDDIWDYLIENRWKKSYNLSLSQLVDDILNSEIEYMI